MKIRIGVIPDGQSVSRSDLATVYHQSPKNRQAFPEIGGVLLGHHRSLRVLAEKDPAGAAAGMH